MAEPMICRACGDEMNMHAEKLDYSAAPEGAVQEIHACPGCGATDSRPSTS
jgi:hypothetical protein